MTTTTVARPQRRAPRLPAQPLFDRIANGQGIPRGGLKLVAKAAGVDPKTVQKWRRQGMTIWQADRIAIRVGLMPHDVWGPGWTKALGQGQGRHYDDETAAWVRGDDG